MPLWDKLKVELDRAGKVAQGALDESKLRLEAFRARQLADRSAQALGYAVYRARAAGTSLDTPSFDRLVEAVAERDRDVASLEERIRATEREEGAPARETPSGAAAPFDSASDPQASASNPPPGAAPRAASEPSTHDGRAAGDSPSGSRTQAGPE